MNTENASSIIAALDAKKLPSQKQIDGYITIAQRFFQRADQQAALINEKTGSSDVGRLSEHGTVLAQDVVEILEAYKVLGDEKNHDDIVQEAFWNLGQSDAQMNVQGNMDTDAMRGTASKEEAKTDAQRLSQSIRSLGNIFVGNLTDEASPLFQELMSFLRLSLADVAGVVEGAARSTKDNLRKVEDEVQEGQRDSLGRTKPELKEGEEDSAVANDPQVKFERRMDAAKDAGSSAIGAGQSAKQTTLEYKDTTQTKVIDAFDNIIRRAQDDPEYSNALSALFDILGKWATKPIDLADDAPDNTNVDNLVDDPDGRLTEAVRQFNTLLERLAGGKSTQNLRDAFRALRQDIRNNSELRQLISDANAFTHRGLEDSDYPQSDTFDQDKEDLMNRWRRILNAETPESQKLKRETQAVSDELEAFQTAMKNDAALARLRASVTKFGKDLVKAGAEGALISQANIPWIWKDILNVYLPLVLEYIKDVPIPRTEYKDNEIEFVCEDLSIESLRLLPGHAHLSTTLNVDADKASGDANATTDTSTKTHLKITGLTMDLKEVSFWYHDPSLKLGSEVKGLMDLSIPERGVDVEATVSLIPTASGRTRRERRGGFHEVNSVNVSLNSDTSISLKKTNHQILITAFKPIVKKSLINAIQKVLAEKVRIALELVDNIAWDIHQRAGVFGDTGMSATIPKYIAAMISEYGRLKEFPGLTTGWKMTSVGLIKDDDRTSAVFAIGAGPQIIPGDKHGPHGTTTSTSAAHDTMAGVASSAQNAKQDTKGAVKDAAVAAAGKVQSFKQSVEAKAAQEKRNEGWRSSAFDVRA